MGPVLVDTSLCIAALRRGEFRSALHEIAPHAPLWLSAVVLEELYAGARGPHRRIVERLEHDFAHSQRLLVPNLDDWRQTGLLLADLAERYGYEEIGRGRLTNDALIAMGAARCGLTLLTANRKDFARLAQFRPFRWQLAELPGERQP